MVEHPHAALVVQEQVLGHQARRTGLGCGLVELEANLAADHQFRQFADIGFRRAAMRDDRTLPHDIDVAGHRHDLAQLVGNEDDGGAARAQGLAECGTAGRSPAASARRSARPGSEFRRRDKAPSGSRPAAVRPTGRSPTTASGSTPRPYSRSDAPVPARAAALPRRRMTPPSAPSMTFSSTVNGSTSMKCWCTMPMPSDARRADCGFGPARRRPRSRRYRPRRSRKGWSSVSTCRRRSRRRCRDGAARDAHRHVAVGVDGAEPLVDMPKLDRGRRRFRRRHRARPVSTCRYCWPCSR